VEPERLAGFLDRFAAGHGGAVATMVTPQQVHLMVPTPSGCCWCAGGYSVGIVRAGSVLTSSAGSRLEHGRSTRDLVALLQRAETRVLEIAEPSRGTRWLIP
jgi:hypothetical protein